MINHKNKIKISARFWPIFGFELSEKRSRAEPSWKSFSSSYVSSQLGSDSSLINSVYHSFFLQWKCTWSFYTLPYLEAYSETVFWFLTNHLNIWNALHLEPQWAQLTLIIFPLYKFHVFYWDSFPLASNYKYDNISICTKIAIYLDRDEKQFASELLL